MFLEYTVNFVGFIFEVVGHSFPIEALKHVPSMATVKKTKRKNFFCFMNRSNRVYEINSYPSVL